MLSQCRQAVNLLSAVLIVDLSNMREIFVDRVTEIGLPGWIIPDYWLMLTFAIISSCLVTLFLWKRSGGDVKVASDLLFWGVLGLFVGARFFYYLQYGFPPSITDWFGAAGFALYGGLTGILTTWLIYYLLKGFPLWNFLDHVTPALGLGLFLGRIGCFMAGCNGGIACDLPWGVRFPSGTSAYRSQVDAGFITDRANRSLPAHPTQLYESLFGLVSFFLLLYLLRERRREGEVFFTGMLWYSVYRFGSEYLRADAGGLHPFELLTFAQFVSVVLCLIALFGLFMTSRGANSPSGEVL